MENRERVHLREVCVVAYRLTESGVEFCLVSPIAENRWEFPKRAIAADVSASAALAAPAAVAAGLQGHLRGDEPLGHFDASRGNESRSMTAFSMHVVEADEVWPQQTSHRRLWCLAEEARVRIRRKPLRRLIDLALHAIGARRSPLVVDSLPLPDPAPARR